VENMFIGKKQNQDTNGIIHMLSQNTKLFYERFNIIPAQKLKIEKILAKYYGYFSNKAIEDWKIKSDKELAVLKAKLSLKKNSAKSFYKIQSDISEIEKNIKNLLIEIQKNLTPQQKSKWLILEAQRNLEIFMDYGFNTKDYFYVSIFK